MKNIKYILLLILSLFFAIYFAYSLSGIYAEICTYVLGFISGISLVLIKLAKNNLALNSYKRELEKESISLDANCAKIKVLESKIEVLEKSLQNALNKK